MFGDGHLQVTRLAKENEEPLFIDLEVLLRYFPTLESRQFKVVQSIMCCINRLLRLLILLVIKQLVKRRDIGGREGLPKQV